MTPNAWIGIACFISMLALLGIGVPIYIAMLLPGIAGLWMVGGIAFVMGQATNAPYNITADYTFAVVPMFLLMGILAGESGIAEGAYIAVRSWVSRIRGGLLIATVIANALFGAVSGVTLASNAVFAKIAMPELGKYGYNRRISAGCIASASVISVLIPPSIPIVIYSILTDISIGKALIAGIIPGIIVMIMLCFTVFIIGIVRPTMIPAANLSLSWRERISSLKLLGPIVIIFLLIMGGMFAGVFPSTVGGAVGAFCILIYALIKRLGKTRILGSFRETVLMSASIFIILIAGFIFSRMIVLTGLATSLVSWTKALQLSPIIILSIIIVIYVILGTALENITILIITLPIVFPLVTSMGFNPYAFCIANVLLGQLASLSPPVGMSVFVVASAAKIPAQDVYKGILPFFFVELLLVWVIMLIPALSTWLPGMIFNSSI
jgi:C4-dicarboxylate transporter, DctM subunit